MNIDPEILKILCCPEDKKQSLKIAPQEIIKKVNTDIEKGVVWTKGGKKVEKPIEGGLVRDDGKVLYPVTEKGIPVLLIEEGIIISF